MQRRPPVRAEPQGLWARVVVVAGEAGLGDWRDGPGAQVRFSGRYQVCGTRFGRGILLGLNSLLSTLGARMFAAVPVVACLECGGEELHEFTRTDYVNDRQYLGIRCSECNWEDGGEV